MRGKRRRKDVVFFSFHLMDSIFSLHNDLLHKTYRHGPYQAFKINDPKPRDIHKAEVRDRLLHHAIYRVLYPYFDRTFIFDSFSCRRGKGTHHAIDRFRTFGRIVSHNYTRTAWVLKCDVRKFFANIDHGILKNILRKRFDGDVLWLLGQVIDSFCTGGKRNIGLPLGNLTSQLFVNIYMNEFDHFVKRTLKVKYYIRYADDFVILSRDKKYLTNILPKLSFFLRTRLKLSSHPKKVSIATLASGIDFLGWIHFPYHRVLRTSTKRRMFARLLRKPTDETRASYKGLLQCGNTYNFMKKFFKFHVL